MTITLNRPDKLNAFDDAMHAGFRSALRDARDRAVRAVVITGAGRGFCVGQDLASFAGRRDVGALLRETYHPNILALRALDKPVIAAVNGAAAGAGLSLAAACDVRIASEAATFLPAFVNVGLVPDSGGTYFLTRLIGPARAAEWMMSGRKLVAAEARDWGLVSMVVPAGELAERAAADAAAMAAMPTAALAMRRRQVVRLRGGRLRVSRETPSTIHRRVALAAGSADPRRPSGARTPARLPCRQGPRGHLAAVTGRVPRAPLRRPPAPVDGRSVPACELDVGDQPVECPNVCVVHSDLAPL